MIEYRDPITGYQIRRYTEGPARNAKLYFTTENFSTDDKYFFFNHQQLDGKDDGGTYRKIVEVGQDALARAKEWGEANETEGGAK